MKNRNVPWGVQPCCPGTSLSPSPIMGKQLPKASHCHGSRGTRWHQCPLLHDWALGKPKKSASKWQGRLWVAQTHRSATLLTGSDKHCLSLQESGKFWTCKPVGGKEKWLRKASPTKVSSENKCNFPGDTPPVFAQVCYLHVCYLIIIFTQGTLLQRRTKTLQILHIFSNKKLSGTSASAPAQDKQFSACVLVLQPSQTCVFIALHAPSFTPAHWTNPASSWPQKQGHDLSSRISHSKNSIDVTLAAFVWWQ